MKLFGMSEKAKYAASRLPSDWPSHLHNKCSVPTCYFPNPPQAAHGTFNCQGIWQGRCCPGTYRVSLSTAAQNHRDQIKREDQARWKAAEIERRKVVKSHLDEEGLRLAAEELAARCKEERKIKDACSDSKTDDLLFSTYLARRAAAQRKRPSDTQTDMTQPTDHITEHRRHHASPIYTPVRYLDLYPPVVGHCNASVDQLNHSPPMPLQASPRSHGSRPATKYPSAPREYNPPRADTHVYNYEHGKSHSRI